MSWVRGISSELRELKTQFLAIIQDATFITDAKPSDPNLWCWSNKMPTNGGLSLTNQQTYLPLIDKYAEWQTLNTRWERWDLEQEWAKNWKQIWGLDLLRQEKLFIWRILMKNMYNMEGALKIGHKDGCFPLCPEILEMNEYIFFKCLKT